MVYKMTSSRIAFVFAIGLAVLALFMINGAEAATLNDGAMTPDDESRVDAAQEMRFTVLFDDADETITNLEIVVWFEGTEDTIVLECLGCTGLDGTYEILGIGPDADTLVETLGSETIEYGIIASYNNSDDVDRLFEFLAPHL